MSIVTLDEEFVHQIGNFGMVGEDPKVITPDSSWGSPVAVSFITISQRHWIAHIALV